MERRSSEKALRSHNLWTISIHVPSPMHLFVIMFISEQGNGTSQWCNCNNSLICHQSTLKLYLTIRIHPICASFRNFINRFDLNSRGFLILRIFIKINPKKHTKADRVKLTAVKPWKVPCFEWDSCQDITARPPGADRYCSRNTRRPGGEHHPGDPNPSPWRSPASTISQVLELNSSSNWNEPRAK